MYIITGHTKGLGKKLITHLNDNKKKTVGLSRSKISLDLNIEEYKIDFSNPDLHLQSRVIFEDRNLDVHECANPSTIDLVRQ